MQAMEEIVLGFLSEQWEGGEIEWNRRSRIWNRWVAIVTSARPWGIG